MSEKDKFSAQGANALPQLAQPGYYPGFSTLAQKTAWDEATRTVVLKRVEEIPPIRFFTSEEVKILQAILDRVLPQDDRTPERRIPILNFIDERLFTKRFAGFIFEGTPEDDRTHRLGLKAITLMAAELYGRPFIDLSCTEQERILLKIRDDDVSHEKLDWPVPASHYWQVLMQDAVGAYYSHPFAWDEIGFGGPAYPRGYMRLTDGLPEPWEKSERRYEWSVPQDSLSGQFRDEKDAVPRSNKSAKRAGAVR